MLSVVTIDEALSRSPDSAVDPDTVLQVAEIVKAVRQGGEGALRSLIQRFEQREVPGTLVHSARECQEALQCLPQAERLMLERVASRIRAFAEGHLATIQALELEIPGGQAGQTWHPLTSAGCYVPGGRYPLVSSLLMTAVTARVAGVQQVWVACPAPSARMLAAGAVAGVDGFLVAGGAHAIAALAYGIGGPPECDVVVGPGNRWVTAAKQLIAGHRRIDMLAGPSELLLVADEGADPAMVAADLLAQAEHDVDARPMLIVTRADLVDRVNHQLEVQLSRLATAAVARGALRNGFAVIAESDDTIVDLCQALAPEHLELHCRQALDLVPRLTRCGCLFIGSGSAEVLGDYGAGPNHVLPTGGTARFASGLSVETFLRRQSWLNIENLSDARQMVSDTIELANWEGLAGHAVSATLRLR